MAPTWCSVHCDFHSGRSSTVSRLPSLENRGSGSCADDERRIQPLPSYLAWKCARGCSGQWRAHLPSGAALYWVSGQATLRILLPRGGSPLSLSPALFAPVWSVQKGDTQSPGILAASPLSSYFLEAASHRVKLLNRYSKSAEVELDLQSRAQMSQRLISTRHCAELHVSGIVLLKKSTVENITTPILWMRKLRHRETSHS